MEEADRPVLLRHVQALNRYEDAIAGDRATGEADAVAALDEVLDRVAETGGIALVAEHEGGVIGYLFLTLDTAPPYVRADLRRRAWVADAFVQEAWRSRGAFQAMLARAEAHARDAGCRRLMIGVLSGNDLAERVYRRAGFQPHALEMLREIAP
jgi:GNAT superfamily N-acetyltransferase